MSSNLSYENIVPQKILGSQSFKDYMLSYLKESLKELQTTVYDQDAVLGLVFNLIASGSNRFAINTGGGPLCVDGIGNILTLYDTSYYTGIYFENSNIVPYYVGLTHCEYPTGISINPITGYPQWGRYREYIGVSAVPNSVVDNGDGTITFTINNSTEANVDNSGRKVKVYKVTPAKEAITEAIAIEECTVFYSGGNNKITTTGSLGQTTISTTAADYLAVLLGPVVKRYTDLRAVSGCVFIGIITGNGGTPSSFDMSDQKIIPVSWTSIFFDGLPGDLFPTLDNTYNLGTALKAWANIYATNLHVGGNFLPENDGTQDLGSSLKKWENLFLSGLLHLSDMILNPIESVSVENNEAAITTGLWSTPWGCTGDSANVISGGSTKRYTNLCTFFNSDHEPMIMVANDDAGTTIAIEIWNARTLTLVDTSPNLISNLPTGSVNWYVDSICTDGTYVYGMFNDNGSPPDNHRIQAWKISDWTVKTGWNATGTALTGTGNGQRQNHIKIVDSTKLATANYWNARVDATTALISIINISDGTIFASGAGDSAGAGNIQAAGSSICSDETNIFFYYEDGGNTFVCTATIANPQVGVGGAAGYPYDVGSAKYLSFLTACGTNMIINILGHNTGGASASDYALMTHKASQADNDRLLVGQNSYSTPLLGQLFYFYRPKATCFDGMNLWILTESDDDTGPLYNMHLLKLDVAKLANKKLEDYKQLLDVVSIFQIFDVSNSSYEYITKIAFDGRDIWAVIEANSSQPNSGKIFRLPFAQLRS